MSVRALCRLDAATAERLAKLCGMFGSHHDGERSSAAALADKLVRSLGLTWQDIIRPANDAGPEPALRWEEPCTVEEALECALYYQEALTTWEVGFVRDLRRKRTRKLSDKQNDILNEIVEKCRVYAMADAA